MRPTFVYFDRSSPSLDQTTSHHVATVLRKSVGDTLTGFDGNGTVYQLEISSISKRIVTVSVLSHQNTPPSSRELVLILSAYKPQRLEMALEKCSEIGVSKFVITETIFSSVALSHLTRKSSRFESIIRQACLQSEQPWFPSISFQTFEEVLATQYSHAWIGVTQEISQTEVQPLLVQDSQAVFIGPEGGFSSDEVSQIVQAGYTPTHPFGTVLRSETAAIAMTALVQKLD